MSPYFVITPVSGCEEDITPQLEAVVIGLREDLEHLRHKSSENGLGLLRRRHAEGEMPKRFFGELGTLGEHREYSILVDLVDCEKMAGTACFSGRLINTERSGDRLHQHFLKLVSRSTGKQAQQRQEPLLRCL